MSDDDRYTTDADSFDPDQFAIPTKRVVKTAEEQTRPPVSGQMEIMSYPDVSKALTMMNESSASQTAFERRREAIEQRAWDGIREIAYNNPEMRAVDASDETRFFDALYEAVRYFERQGGDAYDADLFVHPDTRTDVAEWMDRTDRFETGFGDPVLKPQRKVSVAGHTFTFLDTSHIEPDEIIVADSSVIRDPGRPCVVLHSLPIGIDIQVVVNGENNDIRVNGHGE